MGNGYIYKCSCCGYEQEVFLGCGMLFPQVFKKVNKEVIESKCQGHACQFPTHCEGGQEWQPS